MTELKTKELIAELISNHSGGDLSHLDSDGNLDPNYLLQGNTDIFDSHLDSMDYVEIIMEVENKLYITISDELADKITTVQSLIDVIESRTKVGNAYESECLGKALSTLNNHKY